jgi:hypothetical protein
MLGVALAMVPTLASGAKWVSVGENDSGDTYFVDLDSVQSSGDSKTFWYRANWAQRDRLQNLSVKVQVTINCAQREIVNRWMIGYEDHNNKGKVNFDGTASSVSNWQPIPPDTLFDLIRVRVCLPK